MRWGKHWGKQIEGAQRKPRQHEANWDHAARVDAPRPVANDPLRAKTTSAMLTTCSDTAVLLNTGP